METSSSQTHDRSGFVVVTRPAVSSQGLERALRRRGYSPILLPLLEFIGPPDPKALGDALVDPSFDLWVFTSAAAVQPCLAAVASRSSARKPRHLVAVGKATARVLEASGLGSAECPPQPDADGVLAYLLDRLKEPTNILFPRAVDAHPRLALGLRRAGHRVLDPVAYGKRLPDSAPRAFERHFGTAPFGLVTFTSPRLVRHFVGLAADDWNERRHELVAASIGPRTTATLREFGVPRILQAREPSDEALAEAIAASLG